MLMPGAQGLDLPHATCLQVYNLSHARPIGGKVAEAMEATAATASSVVPLKLFAAKALRPGQLVTTVDDGEEVGIARPSLRCPCCLALLPTEAAEEEPENGHLGAYKPPRIAQAMA